ncbi:MAG: SIR2-like protein [Akkermansiaceae bacterium]|nr:SIR2-like protein [Akkermansiaceae bacterium]
MGQEFSDYLGYVVYRCVCKETLGDDPSTGKKGNQRWDISRQGWPDYPDEDQVAIARKWAYGVFHKLCVEYGLKETPDNQCRVQSFEVGQSTSSPSVLAKLLVAPSVPPFLRSPLLEDDDVSVRTIYESLRVRYASNDTFQRTKMSPTSYAAICEKALRSLCDWRATLQFLATLRYSPGRELLSTEEPDQSIIDRFNVHITRDKKPNLTHVMIAQLSMTARIRVTLTTNFDKLLESAFDAFGRQLASIPVGIHDPLPHPDLVHEQDSLVKLHGDCHETRADFTLDDPATPEDKRRFFHYVRGNFPEFDEQHGSERRFIPSHLLVIGYSGLDTRCNEMLKYVLDSDPEAKIFWMCHSQRDLQRLNTRFSEPDYSGGRIIATVTERSDLLLYDFYQKLNLTLPSAGPTYQFPDRVLPAKDSHNKGQHPASPNTEAERLAEELVRPATDGKGRSRGPIVIVEGGSGVLSVIHGAFDALGSRGKQRLWLELEDFPNAAVVGAEVHTSLCVRTGSLPLSHMTPLPRNIWSKKAPEKEITDEEKTEAWARYFRNACAELGLSAKSWIIGLYGRNGPGGCSGWDEKQYWKQEQYSDFSLLLAGLSRAGFSVLYAPYNKERKKRDAEREVIVRQTAGPAHSPKEEFCFEIPIDECFEGIKNDAGPGADFYRSFESHFKPSKDICFEGIMNSVWQSSLEPSRCMSPPNPAMTPEDWRRGVTAIYSATLYRQSRHFSAFLNDGLFRCPHRFNLDNFDNDVARVETVEPWLENLVEGGMFCMKPGGFAWAYRDTRLGFRHIVERLYENPRNPFRIPRTTGAKRKVRVLEDVTRYRARSQFHIGEWYFKAHRVTGHPMPMMEALHHFYQAAIHCTSAYGKDIGPAWKGEPSDQKRMRGIYQIRFFFQSLLAIHQTLRAGVENLRYWSSAPDIAHLCQSFGVTPAPDKDPGKEGKAATLKGRLDEICREFGKKEKERYSQRGNHLITAIQKEIDKLDRRLEEDYRVDEYPGSSPEKAGHIPPLPPPNPTIADAASNWWETAIPLVQNIVRCVIANSQKTDLWSEVGRQELTFFDLAYFPLSEPEAIHQTVQHLVEWSVAFVRRAKRLTRIGGNLHRYARGGAKEKQLNARECWLVTSILNSVALDLCRLLPVELEAFTGGERAKALSLYGLALGYLGRFPEAHRRLSEARGIVRAMRVQSKHVLLGITELRRAEVLCLEANECGAVIAAFDALEQGEAAVTVRADFIVDLSRRLNGDLFDVLELEERKPMTLDEKNRIIGENEVRIGNVLKRYNLARHGDPRLEATGPWKLLEPKDAADPLANAMRIRQAKIGDAWRCLEEARRSFVGRTHSQRWWGRLYALELRVFGEAGQAIKACERSRGKGEWERYRMLLCRTRRDIARFLNKLWKKGMAVSGDGVEIDLYERLRMTVLYRYALSLGHRGEHASQREDWPISKQEMEEGCANIQSHLKIEDEAFPHPGPAADLDKAFIKRCFAAKLKMAPNP